MVMLSMLVLLLLLCPSSRAVSWPQCHGCGQKPICNCSGQKLGRVPTVTTKAIIELDLSSNELQDIKANDFSDYGGLRVLRLSHNMITTIEEAAFSPMVNLENLDLSFNKLASLSATCFKGLSSLQHLNILGNEYRTLGQGYLFQTLGSLKTLQFGGLFLHTVNLNDFVGLYGLEELVFDGRNLKLYENGSLGMIGHIGQVTLSLHGPFQKDASLITSILLDVSHPNTTLIFTNTKFYKSDIMQPFWVFKQRGVRHLGLRNVSLTDVAFGSLFSQLSNSMLSSLDIEDSKFFLTGRWFLDPLPKLDYFESAVLKNVFIPQFYNFPALFFLAPILKNLRKVSVINCLVHTTPCATSKDFSRLEYIDLSGNLFHDQTMKEMLCDGQSVLQGVTTINISRNNLQSLNSQLFTKLDKLATIDMSGNVFHSMPETCAWPSSLRLLNLSSSHLAKVTRCLPKSLNVLDLSDNDLTVFNIDLPLLTELYMARNNILSLPDGNLYPSLEVLVIYHNALQTFNSKDLDGYNKLRIMEAGSNSYLCSCDFVAFMQGGTGYLSTLNDELGAYVCESPDAMRGTRVLDAELSVFECHTAVALSILCFCMLVVFLMFGGLCYKLNVLWYMKMTWAWLRAKRRPVLKRGDICYDAFVSYSERDSVWVEDHLVANLEDTQPPLRLCLHKRDFLPGGWILDNIMDAIEKSHRTLFILSQHFVKSEWCKYELEYSHFRLFDENNDTAVLILLEPIAKETIPKRFCKLRKVMNSRTYLEWPDDDEQIPRFWQSLKEAIKRPQ